MRGMTAPTNYEIGYVAFIDVLGWKSAVAQSVADPVMLSRLSGVLDRVKQRISEILEQDRDTADSYARDSRAYQFSDAHIFTIAIRENTRVGAEFAAMWCRLIAREYFAFGFLCRGGITIGKLIQRPESCFGPAITKAYELEQSVSLPMIIVDPAPKVQKYFRDHEQFGAFAGTLKNPEAFTSNYFAETQDGRLFIDFLRQDASTNPRFRPHDVFSADDIPILRAKVAINCDDDLRVREKKSWFARYADGSWRENREGAEFKQLDFEVWKNIGRRRLTVENYKQDFDRDPVSENM